MKRFFYAVLGGIFFAAVAPAITDFMVRLQGGYGLTPEVFCFVALAMLPVGIWASDHDYRRREKKRIEEEERQAEQERTNELMRQYFENKLKEEAGNGK